MATACTRFLDTDRAVSAAIVCTTDDEPLSVFRERKRERGRDGEGGGQRGTLQTDGPIFLKRQKSGEICRLSSAVSGPKENFFIAPR